MDFELLTKEIVSPLIKYKSDLTVEQFTDNDMIMIIIKVNKDDMKNVIGKGGVISKAIRNLIIASANINNIYNVKINFEEQNN